MKKNTRIELDFEIDKLTNSIENVVTGDSFATEISVVTLADLKSITKKIISNSTGDLSLNNPNERFTN